MLETRAIAQMKGLLILIKSYIKHICQKSLFDPLLGPRRLKRARKWWIWPYFKSRFCKKYKSKILAISMSYRVIYMLNDPQIWSSYLKNWRSYAKPAKSIQNALFLYTHFFCKVILGGPVRPPILRVEIFFLVKPVQNLYLGKVS